MLCHRCGNNEAVMQVSTVSNGMKRVEYICSDCAGEVMGSPLHFHMPSPFQMAAEFFEDMARSSHEAAPQYIECPRCGMTYHEFAKHGRFGCARCYETFGERLIPIFDDLHDSHRYRGKVPKCAALMKGKDKLNFLVEEKEAAVTRGDFECATELQEQIRALKKGVGK